MESNLVAALPAVHRKVVGDAYGRACACQEQPFPSCLRLPTILVALSTAATVPLLLQHTGLHKSERAKWSKSVPSLWLEDNTLQLMQWEKIHIWSFHNKHSCIQLSFVMMVSHFLFTQPLDLQNQIYCVETTALLKCSCSSVMQSSWGEHLPRTVGQTALQVQQGCVRDADAPLLHTSCHTLLLPVSKLAQ